MTAPATLPNWAEDVIAQFEPRARVERYYEETLAEEGVAEGGPLPRPGPAWPDEATCNHYRETCERFRRRWAAELKEDVWRLFETAPGTPFQSVGRSAHFEPEADESFRSRQAQILFGWMLDIAVHGEQAKLTEKRVALAQVIRLEAELLAISKQASAKLKLHAALVWQHNISGAFDADATAAFGIAADSLACSDLGLACFRETWARKALGGRQSGREALKYMLCQLDHIEHLLGAVMLTDRARAAIFNVAHDLPADALYSAEAVKKARADVRKVTRAADLSG